MGIEGVDYQIVRSEDYTPSPTACDLIEVVTALACASGDSAFAVQAKAGIGRFYADLKKPPYRTLFNPSTSGAKAFNAALALRSIDRWIDSERKGAYRAGPTWGVLIHGNRILAAAVFVLIGSDTLQQPITQFRAALEKLPIDNMCSNVYTRMVKHIEGNYPNKFLAVLFKNSTLSRTVYEAALKK